MATARFTTTAVMSVLELTLQGARLQVDSSDGGSLQAVRIQSSSNQLRIYAYLDATCGTYITSRNSSDVFKPLSFEASSFHFGVGNVGIRTTSPGARLEVQQAIFW